LSMPAAPRLARTSSHARSKTSLRETLVIERVKPPSGIGLGRPVQRSLQFSDLILLGGPSHFWHSPALPCT
jgi:hypothetical protein